MALLFDKGLWIILNNQDRIFGKMLFKCVIDIQLQYDGVKTDIWTADRSRTRTTTIDKQHHRGKGCFFLFLAADCPFNFIITLCCCTLTFQPHDFLSVGVTNLKRLCVNATAGRRLSAVVGCLRWSAALEFWFSRFSSLWTFYFMFQLCHAILSKTYMPWRAEFSKAFSTENSRCYETMKLWNFGTVTVIQPDTDAAAPLQSSCQLSAEPSTVSCWPADCKHRLENGDLGCFKQCADFPLKWEVVFF